MSEDWPIRRLADLTTKIGSGSTPRGGSEAYKTTGIPLIRSQNVHFDGLRDEGLAFLDAKQARLLDGVTVATRDVLLNITGASIGRVTIAPPRMAGARVNQHVSIVRAGSEIDAGFLAAFFASPEEQARITAEESGATRQALTKSKLEEWEVPVPPLHKQHCIVAKLDALRARSRRAKDALDAVPALLDRLRQSILAAAFRGDLTADWREQHPDVEPASELLARIRIERRKRWEEAELAKMTAKGRPPKDDAWKAKYVEPEPADESGLPELPEGWCWASVDELCLDHVRTGRSMRGSDEPPGLPTLRLDALAGETVDLRCVRYSPTTPDDVGDVLVADDDFLVSRGNGSLRLLARGSRVVGVRQPTMFPDTAFRLRFAEHERGWWECLWAAPQVRAQIESRAKTTAGIYKISGSGVATIALPVAPIGEMAHAVAKLPSAIRSVSAQRQACVDVEEMLARCDTAILAAAFRGELFDHQSTSPAHIDV